MPEATRRLALALIALGAVTLAGCSGTPAVPTAPMPAAVTTPPITAAPPTAEPPTAEPPSAEPTLAQIAATFEDADTAPAGALDLRMTIAPAPVFLPAELTAPAGDIVVFLSNPTGAGIAEQHNFTLGPKLQEKQAASPDLGPGASGVLTLADVPAGRYIYWCTVSAHYLAGMRGVLTVTP